MAQRGSLRPAETVTDLLLARSDDNRVALRCGDAAVTWRDLIAQARARAALLVDLRGDGPFHVGILLDNTPEHVFWLYAAAFARATAVGINSTRRGRALANDVRRTDCQILVSDTAGVELLAGLDLGIPTERMLMVDGPNYRDRVAQHRDGELCVGKATPSDRLLLLFTSGSTGDPKAVICSTGRLAAIALSAEANLGVSADDVFYQSMPMFHGNAVMANLAPALALGATVGLRPRFSASRFLSDVRAYGATYFNYVGRALAYVLAQPERPDDGENPLRLGFGTEASTRDRQEFCRRFRCELTEKYGSSEGVVATYLPPGTPAGSVGLPQPRPGSDVAVVGPETGRECVPAVFDAHGRLLNADEAIGEIVDRGGAPTFEGYYADIEATQQRMRNGWYWSGDLAYRDSDGFLYFAGRTADWLRVDSENFAAAPVEAVLARYPDVVMVAVYAVPDPRTGDQVMAAIELVPGARFDPDGFGAFLAAQSDFGTKWAPRFVRIVEKMPLTATNKVDKAPLRKARWETKDPIYWRPNREIRYSPFTRPDARAWHDRYVDAGREHLVAGGDQSVNRRPGTG